MQYMKRVRHPSGVDIIFDAKWHQYKLGSTKLQSVSKTLDKYFPFEEEKILALVSKKKQLPVEVIKEQWQRQALLGKNVHEYIECKLLNKPPPSFVLLLEKQKQGGPGAAAQGTTSELLHGEEAIYLPIADAAVERVKASYDVLGVEQVIASPDWGIAGTIDFVGLNKRDPTRILIGDWKTSGSTTTDFRFGSFESPSLGALRHLPNAKFYRYAMQVIMYGEILKREKYVEKGFFDELLMSAAARDGVRAGETQASTAATLSSETAAMAKRERAGSRKKKGTESSSAPASSPPRIPDLSSFHAGKYSLEYGIVQLSKNDEGGVVAEFKEVVEGTVLPPDGGELTFNALLKKVMLGE